MNDCGFVSSLRKVFIYINYKGYLDETSSGIILCENEWRLLEVVPAGGDAGFPLDPHWLEPTTWCAYWATTLSDLHLQSLDHRTMAPWHPHECTVLLWNADTSVPPSVPTTACVNLHDAACCVWPQHWKVAHTCYRDFYVFDLLEEASVAKWSRQPQRNSSRRRSVSQCSNGIPASLPRGRRTFLLGSTALPRSVTKCMSFEQVVIVLQAAS